MSLRLKTILGVGLIEAVLLIILISTVLNYMRHTNEQALENYVATTSTLFATTTKDAVLSFDLASLETFIEEILRNEGVLYARILDIDNNLLASGAHEGYQNKEFYPDSSYKDVKDDIYDIQQEILVDDIAYGTIQMGFSTQKIEISLAEARELAATIAIIEMLLVALFSFCLGIYLTKQLKVLRESARSVAAGNLDHEIEVKSRDEIGELTNSFNKMISSLNDAKKKNKQYQKELVDWNKTLEQKVKVRTQKILEQKDKLESAYGELQETQEKLIQSEKMASIGQLAAGVAHEINNPVAFVKGNMSSLVGYVKSYQELIEKQAALIEAAKLESSPETKEQYQNLQSYLDDNDIEFINEDILTLINESIEGTKRVSEIVQGLKTYSRASDEQLEESDINEILESSLKMLSNEIKHSCEVVCDFSSVVPPCLCNKGKITQVFTNLIINAVQAMDGNGNENGMGTLSLQTHYEKESSCPSVVVKISDTGKGISEENISKLFDPFFTTKAVGEGTGLGLSISQGIINDHGGDITVESVIDKGTCFTIELPIKECSK